MERIIKKIIDIDKEAVGMEERSKNLIEEKQENLRAYFSKVEKEEEEKAQRRIEDEKEKLREETARKIKELDLKGKNEIEDVKEKYEKSKAVIIKKSVERILK